jgi:monothiol glutaredoxin
MTCLLFMKGTPLFPQCGFSSRAIAILEHHRRRVPVGVDVLQDQGIRQGIKEYSNWPTIPQLYVKGEFVGGSDIMMEMYESGELAELMDREGRRRRRLRRGTAGPLFRPSISSLRAQRSNPSPQPCRRLDCFAALAMTHVRREV